jgi:hypothetical protein
MNPKRIRTEKPPQLKAGFSHLLLAVNDSVWVANLGSYCFLYVWVAWQFHFIYPEVGRI